MMQDSYQNFYRLFTYSISGIYRFMIVEQKKCPEHVFTLYKFWTDG